MIKNYSPETSKSEEITIISNGVKIEGKIISSGNIRIDGDVQGDITSQNNVAIGEFGKVSGQINANEIIIGGTVTGKVKAKEKLVLDSKSKINGDIITKILVVEAGAKFEGQSKMGQNLTTPEAKDKIPVSNKVE
jgi:cytoskeletal protein CcmA (bactofilin family)